MRQHRVYLQQALSGQDETTLDGASAHYVLRVLRLRPQSSLTVFDGHGGEYSATILSATKDQVRLQLGDFNNRQVESPLKLILAQGVARGERMDQVLQKATELGVSVIAPLTTDHTVVRLDAKRAANRHAHWRKIIIGACEQSGRNLLPELLPLQTIDEWLSNLPTDTTRLMLQPAAATTLASLPQPDPANNITVLIGPEGGLSEREQEVAQQKDFIPAKMGPRVLRTETATLAALTIVQARWGDLV